MFVPKFLKKPQKSRNRGELLQIDTRHLQKPTENIDQVKGLEVGCEHKQRRTHLGWEWVSLADIR